MHKQVKLARQRKHTNFSSSDTSPSQANKRLSSIIDSILRTRVFMIWSSIGRLLLVGATVCFATQYTGTSPFNYGIVLLTILWSSLLSSWMQVKIVAEISAGMLLKERRKREKKEMEETKSIKTKEARKTNRIAPSVVSSTPMSYDSTSGGVQKTKKEKLKKPTAEAKEARNTNRIAPSAASVTPVS